MNREDKKNVVEELKEKFNNSSFFYLTDASSMNVFDINNLRRKCFESGVELRVAKNTLIKRAMDSCEADFEPLYDVLKGPSFLMFSSVSNLPAQIVKEFRKKSERPILKAAYIDSDIFIGDENLTTLSKLKSREELIGEIIGLLQSPIKNVISSLQSGGNLLSGLLKTMSDRPEEKSADVIEAKKEEVTQSGEEADTPPAEENREKETKPESEIKNETEETNVKDAADSAKIKDNTSDEETNKSENDSERKDTDDQENNENKD